MKKRTRSYVALRGEPHRRDAVEDARQQRRGLEARQRRADAEVDAPAEPQVAARERLVAVEVVGRGVGEHGLVPVGRRVAEGDDRSRRNRRARDRDVGRRLAEQHAHDGSVPQRLLDRQGNQRPVVPHPLVGAVGGEQVPEQVADEVRRRVDAAGDEVLGQVQQHLLVGQRVAVARRAPGRARSSRRRAVTGARRRSRITSSSVASNSSHARDGRVVLRARRGLRHRDDVVGVRVQLGPQLLGHAGQRADHRRAAAAGRAPR